jgi:hypothetical protein
LPHVHVAPQRASYLAISSGGHNCSREVNCHAKHEKRNTAWLGSGSYSSLIAFQSPGNITVSAKALQTAFIPA